ncbi:3'-5' exonuclease [Ralstonia pickettii]|uniref:3'-5' exonuclease n=1 Tax=Ralstonia pickettii TaxID=329 RepID=UPI001C5FA266|nr:3'-5' exonuclease [Ralstonia pickettii]
MSLIITGLDTETTGLEQADGHRIIEIALLEYDFDSRKLVDKFVQRIDPERSISAGSQAVHGITYEELVGCPKWQDVAGEVHARMQRSDLVIAHNMGFDGPFVGGELLRVGVGLPEIEPFCTMENARWACPDGKFPKLMELCFALGIEYDPAAAHAAEYDVDRMMRCFFAGLDRGFYQLPADVQAKLLKVAA